jgi:hypothetical protein
VRSLLPSRGGAHADADTIAAAAFQTIEVHSSYRSSGDVASKRRVREAINSSLNSLPDWPPAQW